MKQTELGKICGRNVSSVNRDFNNTEFITDNKEIDVAKLFASSSDVAKVLQKKYAALQNENVAAQNQKLQTLYDAKLNEVVAKSNEAQAMQRKIDLADIEVSKAKQEIRALNATISDFENSAVTAMQNTDTTKVLKNELIALKSDKNELIQRNTDLEADLAKQKSLCNDFATKQDNFATSKNALQLLCNEHENDLSILRDLCDTRQKELDSLSDAKSKISILQHNNETQRTEILRSKLGTAKKDNFAFFTSSAMIKFYALVVVTGTFTIAWYDWSKMDIYEESIFGKITVIILAFLFSTSVIFTAFNKSDSQVKNNIILTIFVLAEFANSIMATGILEANSYTIAKTIALFLASLVLPTISFYVAHLNTKQATMFELDKVLNSVESTVIKNGFDNVVKFKNDFIEHITK
jgi:hypothetical protein